MPRLPARLERMSRQARYVMPVPARVELPLDRWLGWVVCIEGVKDRKNVVDVAIRLPTEFVGVQVVVVDNSSQRSTTQTECAIGIRHCWHGRKPHIRNRESLGQCVEAR